MGGIEARKRDHIDLCMDLGDEAEFREKTTWFEYVELVHNALPELDFDDVSLEAELLGRRFSYTLLIEGMTGGTEKAYDVNRSLAEAADRLNIPMGVGSERAGVENRELARTYRVARETSSKLFLIGNISGVIRAVIMPLILDQPEPSIGVRLDPKLIYGLVWKLFESGDGRDRS